VLCHQRGERLYECMGSRCPSVVLWPPCSGVEWRVLEPTIRVLEKRLDAQAAGRRYAYF
jgi:hypothetical protein